MKDFTYAYGKPFLTEMQQSSLEHYCQKDLQSL